MKYTDRERLDYLIAHTKPWVTGEDPRVTIDAFIDQIKEKEAHQNAIDVRAVAFQ